MVVVLRPISFWGVNRCILCESDPENSKYSKDPYKGRIEYATVGSQGDDDVGDARAGSGELDKESK